MSKNLAEDREKAKDELLEEQKGAEIFFDETADTFEKKKNFFFRRYLSLFIAALLAILVWFMVNLYISPNTQQRITGIPIILDEDSANLSQYGLIASDWDGKSTVSVQVTGDRLDISKLTPDSFVAEVNLSKVTDEGRFTLPVSVYLKDDTSSIEINSQTITPQTVDVHFEKLGKKKLDLTFDDSEISVPEDFVKGTITVTPSSVTITGGEDELENVVTAKVIVDNMPSELEDTATLTGKIVLYDASGNEINIEKQTLTLDKTTATVNLPVFLIKELPIKVTYSNVPTDFPIEALRFELSQSTIRIAGPKKTVSQLSEITVGPVDLNKLGPDTIVDLPVDSLPSDCRDIDEVGEITGHLTMTNLSTIQLTADEIHVINAPSGYDIQVRATSVKNVTVVGDKDVLATLTGDNLYAVIDLGDRTITEGQMTVPIKVTVPNMTAPVWVIYNEVPTTVITVKKSE